MTPLIVVEFFWANIAVKILTENVFILFTRVHINEKVPSLTTQVTIVARFFVADCLTPMPLA